MTDGSSSERRGREAYGAALALVLGSVFVTMVVRDAVVGALVAGLFQTSALLAVLVVTQAPSRTLVAARVAGGTAALLAAVLTVRPVGALGGLVPLLWALVVIGVIVAIVRHLARHLGRHRVVTVQSVFGLVTVYVLIGLLFAYGFMLADALVAGFFVSGENDPASFVYFSYVTLATVGYGDLQAVAGLPRALAVAEAVLGQLYLVTVVAVAVGRVGLPPRDAGD